jgi:hypothetical protein
MDPWIDTRWTALTRAAVSPGVDRRVVIAALVLVAVAPDAYAIAESAVVVAAGRLADGGRTVRRHLPFGVPRYGCPIRRCERGLNAVRFPADPAWDVRVSGPGSEGPCLRDRVSRAANPRLGVVIAVHQFENPCAPDRPRTLPLRTLPLRLDGTRLAGRFAGRGYDFEVRVFYGRAAPTAEQRQAAQHMLDRARWPRRIR